MRRHWLVYTFGLLMLLCFPSVAQAGGGSEHGQTEAGDPSHGEDAADRESEQTAMTPGERDEMERELRKTEGQRVLAGAGAVAGLGITGVGIWGVVWSANQLSGGTGGDGLAYVSGLIVAAGSAILAAGGVALTIGSTVGLVNSTSKIERLRKQLEQPRVSVGASVGPGGRWSVGMRFRF